MAGRGGEWLDITPCMGVTGAEAAAAKEEAEEAWARAGEEAEARMPIGLPGTEPPA